MYMRRNMVQAMIDISEHTNRVLNIVKAKFGLKDKSQAINVVVNEYEQTRLEPELRPEYKVKLAKIMNGKHFSREDFEEEVA
ncbi:MAG: hypothetical protein QT07_C0006G0024 [archaeon GW2011_AR16]|nr:MAG: hypothetical protein QT07_C0006G0024 [archaeon GW2011_AR16]